MVNNEPYELDQKLLSQYPGLTMVSRLLDQVETEEDYWLVYEVC